MSIFIFLRILSVFLIPNQSNCKINSSITFQHSAPIYCDVVTSPSLHNQGTSSLDCEEPSHISLDCAHHSSEESSSMINSESSFAHSEESYRRSSSDNESVLNIQIFNAWKILASMEVI